MEQFTEGFLLQASLIVALGAQNLFVLESGLKKRRHFLVAMISSLCDFVLIGFGVLGAATLFVQIPWLKILFGSCGVGFLTSYGILKLREKQDTTFFNPSSKELIPVQTVIRQSLAFSLLNPHAYLDAVVLIGGYSIEFSSFTKRAAFGLGAALFSALWFFLLAFFAASMSKYIHNPKVMRRLSIVSGLVLLSIAIKLGINVVQWWNNENYRLTG